MFFPGSAMYMEKIVVGGEAADAIDISASVEENIRAVAKAKGKSPEEVAVTARPAPARGIGRRARGRVPRRV